MKKRGEESPGIYLETIVELCQNTSVVREDAGAQIDLGWVCEIVFIADVESEACQRLSDLIVGAGVGRESPSDNESERRGETRSQTQWRRWRSNRSVQ